MTRFATIKSIPQGRHIELSAVKSVDSIEIPDNCQTAAEIMDFIDSEDSEESDL